MTKNYKVALITVTQMDIAITAIAGVLQDNEINTKLLNLQTDEYGDPEKYSSHVINQVKNLLSEVEYVGISVHDMFFKRAVFLSKKIKERFPNIIIVMGGIHAELYPDECIQIPHVDAVCVGDGYYAFLDLIRNWNIRDKVDILNCWVKLEDGSIKKTNNTGFITEDDINKLPMPDYTYNNYWLLEDNTENIRWMGDYSGVYSFKQHQIGHKNTYVFSFMTGCIHRCSYCNNWARYLAHYDLYGKNAPRVRYKSSKRMIEEIYYVKRNHKVNFVYIADNDLCIRTLNEIQTFSTLYKQKISLPFYIQVSPDTLNEEKLKSLIDAGLTELNMGIQTIDRININMYNRNITDDYILHITEMINKYVKKGYIDSFYDFIIFNAAMTRDDLIEMIDFIRKIPVPFDQVSHHLTLGPEVELYKKFQNDNLIYARDLEKMYESNYHDFDFDEYSTFPNFYLNLIIEWMAGRHDHHNIGRLPRNPEKIIEKSFCQEIRNLDKNVYNILEKNTYGKDDIRDFLLSKEVEEVLTENINILKFINSNLPELLYTNQKQEGVYRDEEN